MTAAALSESRSATCGPVRSDLRTGLHCGPPRQQWVLGIPRLALRQLTTRPPRSGRSGSQLPVETGVMVLVQAGRTAVLRRGANGVWM